jgi:hypothetical protein
MRLRELMASTPILDDRIKQNAGSVKPRKSDEEAYFLMVEMNASTSGTPPWKIR